MLNNYIIEKELGKGTYGIVYIAKKKDDKNIYVIKQISLTGLSQSQKEEVKLESKILKSINSKYVVKYYDSFEEDNKLNIVMEYCECGDLNDFIEKQKKTKHLLQENLIWKFFIKITLGLADIHKLKILHRDLKSLNIFLKQENDVRVGDLGVAKVLNHTFFAKTFIGTPYYLSPEICEDKPYNDKSDVWALGCILYELCTYQHPFNSRSQGGLILKILNDSPKPINNCYSKDLKNLVNIILDKDYHKRPSCQDILKMNFVIDKAKNLGIYDDIKDSFPDIETSCSNDKIQIKKSHNKNVINVKPVIIINNKNKNNNAKKRPASGVGIFGKGGNKHNIKFNNFINGPKKKNDNLGGLNIPNKKKVLPKKLKIIPSKDNDNNKNNKNKNKEIKKSVISQKEKDIIFGEAEKFEKKFNINKDININNNNNKENNPTIFLNREKKDDWINTNDLNNVVKDSSNTKDKSDSNINNNNNDNNNNDLQKGTIKPSFNYSIDSNYNKDNDINKNINIISINSINSNFDKTKEKKDNNNCSLESDIYMTCKKDIYQSQSIKKEENIEQKNNIKNDEKKVENNNNFAIDGSLPLMKTNEFNELLSDFDSQKDATVNDFKIINNNIEKNIDNNKSLSSEDEKDENKYFSDNDKSNNESDNEEEVKVTEIIQNKENIEEKKNNLKNDLQEIKAKIDRLKESITKLISEEKYKYIMEMCSIGIKDDKKQEEVNDKIEEFIQENCENGNEEKMYDILSLFILQCQYYKKQEQLNKL